MKNQMSDSDVQRLKTFLEDFDGIVEEHWRGSNDAPSADTVLAAAMTYLQVLNTK